MAEISKTIIYSNIDLLLKDYIRDVEFCFNTSIFVKKDKAECIIKAIISEIENLKICYINFDASYDFVDKEYEIAIASNGKIKELYIEPCWFEGNEKHPAGYFNTNSSIAYVDSECENELLNHISADINVFSIEE